MMRTQVSIAGMALLSAAMWAAPLCFAHNHGPPPMPPGVNLPPGPKPPDPVPLPEKPESPQPPPELELVLLRPARWSWLHWWEANRDEYLHTIRQTGVHQRPSPEAMAKMRGQAAEALAAAAENKKSNPARVRAAAALALGRMGEVGAFGVLRDLVENDPSVGVRSHALTAVGLLNFDVGEGYLRARQKQLLKDQRAAVKAAAGGAPPGLDAILTRQEAALCGMGLRNANLPDTIVGLQAVLKAADPGPGTMAAWALKRRTDPANSRFLRQVLRHTPSPWLASESILSLGQQGQVRDIPVLSAILLARIRQGDLLCWDMLHQEYQSILGAYQRCRALVQQYSVAYQTYKKRHAEFLDEVKQYEKYLGEKDAYDEVCDKWLKDTLHNLTDDQAWDQMSRTTRQWVENWARRYAVWIKRGIRWPHLTQVLEFRENTRKSLLAEYGRIADAMRKTLTPNAVAPTPGPLKMKRKAGTCAFEVGRQAVYLSRLRASAAIALGGYTQRDAQAKARKALLQALREPDDDYSDLYKGFVIMSLAAVGNEHCADVLAEIMSFGEGAGVPKSARRRHSPLRGYAALALGLYARPMATPQGSYNRPSFEEACKRLAARLKDPREALEVRAACAVGLGLSSRTSNLKTLARMDAMLERAPVLLRGYVLLARGMLGDRSIPATAKRLLREPGDEADISQVLGRRAAVLALGLSGTQEAIPVLHGAWHQSYFVNREVGLATALCGAYNSTDPLVKLLRKKDEPVGREFAARCLGELFEAKRPQRLSWLTSRSNYTMKNMRMIRFQTLSNEFLFNCLIPLFGDQWR